MSKMYHSIIGLSFIILAFVTLMFISGKSIAQTDSDRFSIESHGSGDPVIIIPGLSSSPDAFQDALNNLEIKGRTTHWITLAGFGGVPAPEKLNHFTNPAAHSLAQYIEKNNLQRVALVGHSMGGLISLLIAAEQPDRVQSILIIDSVPFLAGLFQPGADPEQTAARKDAMLAQFQAMTDDQFAAMMRQGLPIQATSKLSQDKVWRDIERSDRKALAMATAEVFSTDYRKILSKVKAKVTVLIPHNSYSPGTPEQMIERYSTLYAGLENVEFKIVENSRHFIMLDQPEAFAHELDVFVKDLP
ncbi:MAG: alpha/beta hydrolase [Robiginitomaculum sp.]|nr:alpha/beta hydrolase [Robiginitomaculum sp.]